MILVSLTVVPCSGTINLVNESFTEVVISNIGTAQTASAPGGKTFRILTGGNLFGGGATFISPPVDALGMGARLDSNANKLAYVSFPSASLAHVGECITLSFKITYDSSPSVTFGGLRFGLYNFSGNVNTAISANGGANPVGDTAKGYFVITDPGQTLANRSSLNKDLGNGVITTTSNAVLTTIANSYMWLGNSGSYNMGTSQQTITLTITRTATGTTIAGNLAGEAFSFDDNSNTGAYTTFDSLVFGTGGQSNPSAPFSIDDVEVTTTGSVGGILINDEFTNVSVAGTGISQTASSSGNAYGILNGSNLFGGSGTFVNPLTGALTLGSVPASNSNLIGYVTFPPSNLIQTGQSIELGFDIKYDTAAQNSNQALRFGLYDISGNINRAKGTNAGANVVGDSARGYYITSNPGQNNATGSVLYEDLGNGNVTTPYSAVLTNVGVATVGSFPSVNFGAASQAVRMKITKTDSGVMVSGSIGSAMFTFLQDSLASITFDSLFFGTGSQANPASPYSIDNLQIQISAPEGWRSKLYPENWTPGYVDGQGRFLHDFSYASYHKGEKEIPNITAPVFNVTQPPYNADATGVVDATSSIQAAIDAAATAGGGVVYLPAGIYRVAPSGGNKYALKLHGNNTVVRGAGMGLTKIYNSATFMRESAVILIEPNNRFYRNTGGNPFTNVAANLLAPTTVIPVSSTNGFAIGQMVVLRSDISQPLIDAMNANTWWSPGFTYPYGPQYCRRVTAVNPINNTITVDVPLRGFIYLAGNPKLARQHPATNIITESGLEDLSIGMQQHPNNDLDDDPEDWGNPAHTAYALHWASAVSVQAAENCWVRRVSSFRPASNSSNIHLLSHGVRLLEVRQVTVEDCDFRFPQYRGDGGNGYMFTIYGNDNLLNRCYAEGGRHNFSFGEMTANGNVLLDIYSKNGRLPSDYHMHLSMVNLIDNATMDGDYLSAAIRNVGSHGITTSESVFWNTYGKRYMDLNGEYGGNPIVNPQVVIKSEQGGNGYIIGTRGPAINVQAGDDYYEGGGQGDLLQPASLYVDQLERRLGL